MMQPPTAARTSPELGPEVWRQVRAFGLLCLVTGTVFSDRLSAFARGGLWPWVWGAAMVGAVVAVLSLGRQIRALLIGPAEPRSAAPATAPGVG